VHNHFSQAAREAAPGGEDGSMGDIEQGPEGQAGFVEAGKGCKVVDTAVVEEEGTVVEVAHHQ